MFHPLPSQQEKMYSRRTLPTFGALPIICLTIVVGMQPVLSGFITPSSQIDLHTWATVTVSQHCGSDCHSSLNESCVQLGVCKTEDFCNGRTALPGVEYPLRGWQIQNNNDGCNVTTDPPDQPPPTVSMMDIDARTLIVNGSASSMTPCYLKRNRSITDSDFTLIFWLRVDCRNCSILEMPQNSKPSVHVRVVRGSVCIDDKCVGVSTLSSTQWTMMSVRMVEKQLRIFSGDTMVNFNYTEIHLDDISVENLYIGSDEIAPTTDIFHLYYVRYYTDALTQREIKYLMTGMRDLSLHFSECQCPSDFIDLVDSDSKSCADGKMSFPRFNSTIVSNEANVVLNSNSSERWASSEQGSITLMLAFNMSFQIISLEIIFVSDLPEKIAMQISSGGTAKQDSFLTCSGQSCSILKGPLAVTSTKTKFESHTAEEIRIVLHRKENTAGSFIISNIIVKGRCDCNGNAGVCTTDNRIKNYTCECDSSTNTQGENCRSCSSNFFRNSGDFDCPNACKCDTNGVKDGKNQCNEMEGACICKVNVEGEACDTCKPFTFNLSGSNSDGCSRCQCNMNGTKECRSDAGACECKDKVKGPFCEECEDSYYGLDNPESCQPCNCNIEGRVNKTCNEVTGQCYCKDNVEGMRCDICRHGFFGLEAAKPQGCQDCECHKVGIEHEGCDKETGACLCRGGYNNTDNCKPVVESVDPVYGPEYGGTLVTVTGHLLGNETHGIMVFLGSVQQKTVLTTTDTEVVFNTTAYDSTKQMSSDIKLSWNKVNDPLNSQVSFSYRINPVADFSRTAGISTFASGGCLVYIYGSNLQSVKYPRLEVIKTSVSNRKVSAACHHRSGNILCPTPNVTELYSSSSDTFQMTAVLDGEMRENLASINVLPDPQFSDTGTIRFQYPFEDSITIKGKGFTSACHPHEFLVLIGSVTCTITHISDTAIECEPAVSPPGGRKRFDIEVRVGNIKEVVGTLQYLDLYETTGFIIIISCIVAAILIVAGTIIICCCCRYRRAHRSNAPAVSIDNKETVPEEDRPMNNYSELTTPVAAPLDNVEYGNVVSTTTNGHCEPVIAETVFREPKKGIPVPLPTPAPVTNTSPGLGDNDFLSKIELGLREEVEKFYVGSGQFAAGRFCALKGQVAQLTDGSFQKSGAPGQKLTIKSLIHPVTESQLPWWATLALQECLRLRRHSHTHVLGIVGIGIDQQRFHILYPHMSHYILKTEVSDISKDFSVRQLLSFAQQVAEAIDFLASKDITHKDVAARNCMLDEYSVVKLGDAAFSWDFYQNEYVYDEQRERYLPIRWMAPESITDGYYDMRTDVWSYGILIWELLTRGCLPFHEVTSAEEVSDYILQGYILGKPDTLTDELYELLRSCWSPDNEMRPSIAVVSRSLSEILEGDDDGTYANAEEVASFMARDSSGRAGTPRKHSNGRDNIYSSAHLSRV